MESRVGCKNSQKRRGASAKSDMGVWFGFGLVEGENLAFSFLIHINTNVGFF